MFDISLRLEWPLLRGRPQGQQQVGVLDRVVCRSLDLLGSVITFSVMRLFLSRSNLVDHALRQKGHFFVSGTLITVQKGGFTVIKVDGN